MSKETGGNAFPIPGLQHDEDFNGMTLRDYFAATAINGLMGRVWTGIEGQALIETWATSAYAVADAMLAERDK